MKFLTYLERKILKFANLAKNCSTRFKQIVFCIGIDLLPYFLGRQGALMKLQLKKRTFFAASHIKSKV